jgi:hypothetical protein
MSEINDFKVLLLYKMMWWIVLDECWRDMVWLNIDMDIFHAKKISLNNL